MILKIGKLNREKLAAITRTLAEDTQQLGESHKHRSELLSVAWVAEDAGYTITLAFNEETVTKPFETLEESAKHLPPSREHILKIFDALEIFPETNRG